MNPLQFIACGADPEVFFIDPEGVPRSAEGLIGGSKKRPRPMEGLPRGFMIQEDNVAAEYNIPPVNTAEAFADNILAGLKYIEGQGAKHQLKVICCPDLDFPELQLQTRHAQTLGCDPDYNVWLQRLNPSPVPPLRMRTAAGHVHCSWQSPTDDQQIAFGKACDLFLGVPSILVTKPNRRRSLYGRAGAVRLKRYGLEYRAMDNFWLTRRDYAQQVFVNCVRAIEQINMNGDVFLSAVEDFSEEIQSCINNHDINLANLLVDRFGVPRFPA